MFGYIKTYKPELRIREYETYKAVYCSQCKEIGRHFGILVRFSLNYDFTFLSLLRLSLSDQRLEFSPKRCTFNPLKKCRICTGQSEIVFSVYALIIMYYYKIRDNIKDTGFRKKMISILLYPFIKRAYRKAIRKQPDLDIIFSKYIRRQNEVEILNDCDIDRAAEPTALALAELFSFRIENENNRRALERLGYCIGRWIYLTDAADDLEDDQKRGSYNVFLRKFHLTRENEDGRKDIRDYAESALNLCAAEAAKAFELLEIKQYRSILENILYMGLASVQNQILKKEMLS